MRIAITLSTGERVLGDPEEEGLSFDEAMRVVESIAKWDELSNISLMINDKKVYYNPAHVVSIEIVDR